MANSAYLSRRLLLSFADPAIVATTLMFFAGRYAQQESATYLPWDRFVILSAILIPGTSLCFRLCGAYEDLHLGQLARWCQRALLGFATLVAGTLLVGYLLKEANLYSRLVILEWMFTSVAGLILVRVLVHAIAARQNRLGIGSEPCVVVGAPATAMAFVKHLDTHPELGLRVAGLVPTPPHSDPNARETALQASISGRIRPIRFTNLAQAIHDLGIQRVIVVGNLADQQLVERVSGFLLRQAVTVQFAPDLSALPLFNLSIEDLAGQPVINLSGHPLSDGERLVKWLEDKILGLTFLGIASPVMLVVAVLVKLTSPGPVLYIQERHGLGGRPIRVMKFRTMRPARPGEEFVQATADDPRITRLGRFLRRTSLDELPQFFNVLRGDMSIVGPRPHAIAHNHQFLHAIPDLMRRHYLKPGITGLAQISGSRGETRTDEDMRTRVRLDLQYIVNWSLMLDLRIIAMTILKGFFNRQP